METCKDCGGKGFAHAAAAVLVGRHGRVWKSLSICDRCGGSGEEPQSPAIAIEVELGAATAAIGGPADGRGTDMPLRA